MSLSVIYTSMQRCLSGPWPLSTPFQMSEDKEKIVGSHRRTGKENSASRTNELSFSGGEKSMCLRRWRTRANSSESDRPKEVTGRHPVWGSCAMPLDPGKAEVLGQGLGLVCESSAFSQKRRPLEHQQLLAGLYPRWPSVAASLLVSPRIF